MTETKELRKFEVKHALILASMGIGFGMISFAVFLQYGIQQAIAFLGGGFIIRALMVWWRFIK